MSHAPMPQGLRHFALALITIAGPVLHAAEMPGWVLPGILMVESRSHYGTDGAIVYVDQRIGAAGELGPFQMTAAAFHLVAHQHEMAMFERLRTDTAFAEDMAKRYLQVLWRTFADRDWFLAVGRWNAGPHGALHIAWSYAKRAQQAGTP